MMYFIFLCYFPIRRKVTKGTTKEKRDCDLPLPFGNPSPSNACFCYHGDQSAASQTRAYAPLAAIGFLDHIFCSHSVLGMRMYALVEMGSTDDFRRKTIKIFSDIDALAVSMSEKFLRVCRRHTGLSFKKRPYSPS